MHYRPCRKAYDGLYIIPMTSAAPLGPHIILGVALNVLTPIKSTIQYEDILVPAYSGCPEKHPLKRRD